MEHILKVGVEALVDVSVEMSAEVSIIRKISINDNCVVRMPITR